MVAVPWQSRGCYQAPRMLNRQGSQHVQACMAYLLVLCHSTATNRQKSRFVRWLHQAVANTTVVGSLAHLVWSFAMVMLIHVICNCVDVKGTDHFSDREALLERVVHACRQGIALQTLTVWKEVCNS